MANDQIVIAKEGGEKKLKGFHLPKDLRDGIEQLAAESGQDQSELVAMALRDFLKKAVVRDA